MNGVEYFVEAIGDVVQVLEGELTVVELSVGKNLVDQILHKALDSGRRGIGQSPGGRLDDIGQEGLDMVRELAAIIEIHGLEAQIIVASTRTPRHVVDGALAGAQKRMGAGPPGWDGHAGERIAAHLLSIPVPPLPLEQA